VSLSVRQDAGINEGRKSSAFLRNRQLNWSEEEDNHLTEQVKEYGKDWKKVASFGRVTGTYRSALQCKLR
jgi:hypothetical protein